MPDWEWTQRELMRYQSLDCAPRVRLSSGGPGRDPNPEFPPRNPISDRLRLPVSRSGYRKKGWRVAQPKDPPAPSLAVRYGPLVEREANVAAQSARSSGPANRSDARPNVNVTRVIKAAAKRAASVLMVPEIGHHS